MQGLLSADAKFKRTGKPRSPGSYSRITRTTHRGKPCYSQEVVTVQYRLGTDELGFWDPGDKWRRMLKDKSKWIA